MFMLMLAESALERVPRALWNHPSVVRLSERRGKKPGEILLDRSYHHAAMFDLENAQKRGRPDIVHFSLLEALGTPLNKEGFLRVYVHTIDNHQIHVDPKVRLPRNYDRFLGLMEQLYGLGRAPPKGRVLLELKKGNIPDLMGELKPTYVVALTRRGRPKTLEEVVHTLASHRFSAAIVGGFPHGHFTDETTKVANEIVSIDPEMLESWTVTSRIIYDYERAIGLPERRVRKA